MLVSPYSLDDFIHYAETLMIVGGFRGMQKAGIRKNFVQIIAKMPPWQQVILMESKFSNISGDDDTINKLGDQLPGTCDKVLGFYDDQRSKFTLSAREEFETVCGIFWTFDIYGTHDAPTFFHEQGHRLLEILKEECEFDFFNGFFTRRRWEDACAHEVISQGMTRDTCETSLRQPEKLNARSGISLNIEALYEGYRTINDHLVDYNWEDFSTESFAEVNAHYCMLYALNGGDEVTIDRILSTAVPFLWPIYRDTVIPECVLIAEDLLFVREKERQKHLSACKATLSF